MQYLAEVHKKTGFMGTKTELKLLARQQSEQNWSTLPGEEMLPVEISGDYNDGVLVLVELDANRQVKRIQDATRHLVAILKNFSRMRDKFRTQEEEIEGWKQSLIYQSQELTRREVDIEARAEELQQLESESQKMEVQRQEFEATRDQILKLKEEIESERQQLEEAWGKLHNSQEQFAQQQQSSLSDEQVSHLETLMGRLESSLVSGETVNIPLQNLRGSGDAQNSLLQQLWQQLEQEQQAVQSAQADLDQQTHDLAQAWQQWHQENETLQGQQQHLKVQQASLGLKRSQQEWLAQQLQTQQRMEQGLINIRKGQAGDVAVDISSLKSMPIDELGAIVDKLQAELKKLSTFVADQEEELKYQREAIDELQVKINQASEYDRLSLASDIEYEQQNYRLLDETLEGQRQTLQDRVAVLELHEDILSQRRGNNSGEASSLEKQIDALLQDLSVQQQSLQSALQSLEQELVAVNDQTQQQQASLEQSLAALTETRTNLQNRSNALDQRRFEVGQLSGRVAALQNLLQPMQDQVDRLHQSLNSLWAPLEHAAHEQPQIAAQLKQTIMTLGQAAEGVS